MKIIFNYLFSFIIFIILWWTVQYVTNSPSYILPNPYKVFLSIKNNFTSFISFLYYFFEILVGFIMGIFFEYIQEYY